MRVVGRILADCMVSQRSQYSATVGVVLRKTASSIWRCASSTFQEVLPESLRKGRLACHRHLQFVFCSIRPPLAPQCHTWVSLFLSCHSFTSLNVGISCRICEDEQVISFWDGAACGMSSCYRQVLPSLCIWQHIPEALHL